MEARWGGVDPLTGTAAVSFSGVLHVGVSKAGKRTTVSLHSFVHFLTDYIHQSFKHLLYVDVVFGTGFKELESWKKEPVELKSISFEYSR